MSDNLYVMWGGYEANKVSIRDGVVMVVPHICQAVHLLADVCTFHVTTKRWLHRLITKVLVQGTEESCHPRARHPDAHSATALLVLAYITNLTYHKYHWL